jgi:hypothetical protein
MGLIMDDNGIIMRIIGWLFWLINHDWNIVMIIMNGYDWLIMIHLINND